MGKGDDIDALVNKFKEDNADETDSDEEDARPKKPFVDHYRFNLAIGGLIALNALVMGLETDARGSDGEDASAMWYVFELIFCLIFLSELLARLWFHRTSFFTKPYDRVWNILDFLIVIMSVLDAMILYPIGLGGGMRFMTMLRFVRLARLIRLVRLLRIFKELWLVADGLIQSAKTLSWLCFMMLIMLYICGTFTTLMIGKDDNLYDPYFRVSDWDHEEFFKTVPRSMFTLFQLITFESWSEGVVRHVMQVQPGMVVFFVLLVAFASFGVLSLVIGVIVENTLATSAQDANKMKKSKERDRQKVFNQLRDIFEGADEDGSGTLTLSEVEKAINKPEIYNKLKMIEFPVDNPEQIFELLDFDGSNELTIEAFIIGCIRMKGPAMSKDLLEAQVAVDAMKRHYTQFECEMKVLQAKVAMLEATARALVIQGEHVFLNVREYRMRHPEMPGRMSMPSVPTEVIGLAPWEGGLFREDASKSGAARDGALIVIINAKDLMVADIIGGKSDPYVVTKIMSDGRNIFTFQTKVIKASLNPVWNYSWSQSGYFPAADDSIEFKVFDKDPWKRDDFLGSAVLYGRQLYPSGFEGDLDLQGKKSIQGKLRVKVDVSGHQETAAAAATERLAIMAQHNAAIGFQQPPQPEVSPQNALPNSPQHTHSLPDNPQTQLALPNNAQHPSSQPRSRQNPQRTAFALQDGDPGSTELVVSNALAVPDNMPGQMP